MTKRLDRYSAQEIPTSAKFNQMVDAVNTNTEALENKANKDEVPDVPDWAMNPVKPSYTASEVGAMPADTNLFSGSYDDLSDKPVIPTLPDNIVTDPNYTHTDNNFTDAEKEKLGKAITEHQKIKTVNGQSLVGEGNILISGGEGGSYDDTELREIINSKQDIITDLESIRSSAAAGLTALQPVEGKGLSSNDYTDDDKQKLESALEDAPSDGKQYARQNGDWHEVEGGGGTSHDDNEQVIVHLIANDDTIPFAGSIVNINGVDVIIDKLGKAVAYVAKGTEYTITLPTVEGYITNTPTLSFTAENYIRNVDVKYRKSFGDLRDVARSFVVEASSSPVCELTGNEEVIDRILSHGSYVIDETNKKYARLSETDSNVFEDGTPWNEMYGNAFRYLPKVYILHDKTHADSGQKYWVSDEPIGGDDAYVLPESWIGMYKASIVESFLRSIPNAMAANNKTITQFWNNAQRVGTDYGLVNYFDHQKINALHLAKFGNTNSDETVGIGLCNAGYEYYNHMTGSTAALGNGTGNAPYLSTQFNMVRLFGIEDLFGTTWEFRPNIRFDNGQAIIYEGNIVSNIAEGVRSFARLQSAAGQYIRNMALGDSFDLVAVNASGASESTYWCDGGWASASGQVLIVGGASDSGSFCGLSAAYSCDAFSYPYATLGARLAFKGDINDYQLVTGAELASLHS